MILTYAKAFEVAELVARERRIRGGRYREGVEREAALAAVAQASLEGVVAAIENTFHAMRVSLNPRWDGSIA